MTFNSIAGLIGFAAQIALFLTVLLFVRRRELPLRTLFAMIAATFGYSLFIAATSFLSIPWQLANAVLLVVLSAPLFSASVRTEAAAQFRYLTPKLRHARGGIMLVGLLALFHFGVNVLKPAIDVDGQLYHGPALANLLTTGSLWGWSYPNQYLAYTDLTMAGGVNFATVTGTAQFDDAIQVPYLLLLVCVVVWVLAERYRSVTARTVLGILIVSAPVIWLQPRVLYVDVAYAAAVVTSVALIIRLKRFGAIEAAALGVSIAAVFATKPTGLLTGLLLLALALTVMVLRRVRSAPPRAPLGWFLVAFGAPLALGSVFYVRNLVQFRNPVFPIDVGLGPIHFSGIVDFSTFASGARGSGLIDPGRWLTYAANISSGALNGVTKLDYDPREGGFGWIPLVILALVALSLAIQLFAVLRRRARFDYPTSRWRQQAALIGVALVVLAVQPATFDSRYVIGPTVLLLCALLMTSLTSIRTFADRVVPIIAIVLVVLQVGWTEARMHSGLRYIADLATLSKIWQPPTPGNPWGPSQTIAWLGGADAACTTIALQTSGGLTPTGLAEPSFFSNQPYGLYGEKLCNTVRPIVLPSRNSDDHGELDSLLAGSGFALLYEADLQAWNRRSPTVQDCYVQVARIEGNPVYTEDVAVLANTCK